MAKILEFCVTDDGFELHFAGRAILRHAPGCPAVAIARGVPKIEMLRGNFRIEDSPTHYREPVEWRAVESGVEFEGVSLSWQGAVLTLTANDPADDRLHLRFHAKADEAVWGGGEQMSYLQLNGRRFPMWTSEPGVGRDKTTELTRAMDEAGMAGGD